MPYNRALDGVRAISILAVVFFHCRAPWGDGGFIGVDVFFVLSGYLITSMLASEQRAGGIDIGAFYTRRVLRLYPTLLLLLVAYLALAPFFWPADDRWLGAVFSGAYLMDYALAFRQVSTSVGHTWSLGIEEKFYLLWPLLLPVLLRTRRPIMWLLIAFVLATTWRYFVTLRWGWMQGYFSFDTRTSGILLGAVAALTRPRFSRYTILIACAALAIIVVAPIIETTARSVSVAGVTLGVTLAEICAFVLVCYLADHEKSSFLASPPMAYIGRLSYGIYLWHFPLVVLLRDIHLQPWWITLSATVLFSFTMAAICLHFVDAPLKRWRTRTWPLRTEATSLGAHT